MTHALADFENVYRRCVERIDVNWLVELLDLVNWDDLGPRVWERAVVICSPHLREMCDVRVSRGLHSTDNSDPAAAGEAVRQNLSASHPLHTQPWIHSWALQWFRWTQHQQNPDGLFTIRLAHRDEAADEIVLCYECDADSKGQQRKEMRKVVMKMWQAVDAARWTRGGARKRRSLSAYTVRSNVMKTLQTDEESKVKRGLAWLYRFMCAHIRTFLLLTDDWLATKQKHAVNPDAPECLPREKDRVWDHHFFIGLFTVPDISTLVFRQTIDWNTGAVGGSVHDKEILTADDYEGVDGTGFRNRDSFLHRGAKDKDQKIKFDDYPLPLVCKADNPVWDKVPTFRERVKQRWRAPVCLRVWENYDVRALSVQRVNVENAIAWAELRPREQMKHFERLGGAWYLTDVKQFLEYFSTQNSDAAGQVFDNLIDDDEWTRSIRERQLGDKPEKRLRGDRVAQITQNVMTELETALLSVFKTNGGFGDYLLSWDAPPYASVQREFLKGPGGTLTAIKRAIRDQPGLLRERQGQKNVEEWEDYNKKNQTLRSACYCKLEESLPALSDEVDRYLDAFKVPNAKLFFRLIRCNSILALRELARQVSSKRMDGEVSKYLKTLDVCVQSEVNFIFDRVRENLDVFIDNSAVRAISTQVVERAAHSKDDLLLQAAQKLGFVNAHERFAVVSDAIQASAAADPGDYEEDFYEVYEMLYGLARFEDEDSD
tara:strand:- start:3841 stop:5985 length:2145 start_codon:yes stop_codon:yes gene_type:complete